MTCVAVRMVTVRMVAVRMVAVRMVAVVLLGAAPGLGLAAPAAATTAPVAAQAPPTPEAPTTTSSFVPPPGVTDDGAPRADVPNAEEADDLARRQALDASVGPPALFVALSLLGGFTALAIMAFQWFRTRPD